MSMCQCERLAIESAEASLRMCLLQPYVAQARPTMLCISLVIMDLDNNIIIKTANLKIIKLEKSSCSTQLIINYSQYSRSLAALHFLYDQR